MRLIRHRMDTRRVNPSVVEIEQGTDRDSEVELFVRPIGGSRDVEILGSDTPRLVVDLIEQLEERLVTLVERRRSDVTKDRLDQAGVIKQFRRNCGVRLDSKGTVIALRGIRGDQFAQAGTER